MQGLRLTYPVVPYNISHRRDMLRPLVLAPLQLPHQCMPRSAIELEQHNIYDPPRATLSVAATGSDDASRSIRPKNAAAASPQ